MRARKGLASPSSRRHTRAQPAQLRGDPVRQQACDLVGDRRAVAHQRRQAFLRDLVDDDEGQRLDAAELAGARQQPAFAEEIAGRQTPQLRLARRPRGGSPRRRRCARSSATSAPPPARPGSRPCGRSGASSSRPAPPSRPRSARRTARWRREAAAAWCAGRTAARPRAVAANAGSRLRRAARAPARPPWHGDRSGRRFRSLPCRPPPISATLKDSSSSTALRIQRHVT